ncbi:MAG: hypothetical protein KAT70_02135 [Thermoplasmata archaeon]|nr:hypothetical protein [Thermoplasmata archaeon]
MMYDRCGGNPNKEIDMDSFGRKGLIQYYQDFNEAAIYLVGGEYTRTGNWKADKMYLSIKGIDEVENEFPQLKPQLQKYANLEDLIVGLAGNDETIKARLDDISGWERYLVSLNIDVNFIKKQLDEMSPHFKDDEEIMDIIMEAKNAHWTTQFASIFWRLINHPKTRGYMRKKFPRLFRDVLPSGEEEQ